MARSSMSLGGLLLVTTATWSAIADAEESPAAPHVIPPAIGPHVNLTSNDFANARSFGGDERIVMTYYFYWYDVHRKAHLLNGDGSDALTTHPASMTDFSYKSVGWHKRQLSDMTAAGIDVVLPVYWGAPSERDAHAHLHWSFDGLGPLVQAAQELEREGKRPPRIGLFYDTSTLQNNSWGLHIDLTTDFGRKWFYASIRDFFSLIPPSMWAMIDGRPIVGLYSAAFAKAHDQSCIDYVRGRFARDFAGRVPYIVREISWRVASDNVYKWGGAIRPSVLGVAELGPGYDHSHVPGRTPLVASRDGGRHYENAWVTVLRRSPRIVAIETWNEFHEGTDIAESREYGRQYIDLTRKYADRFKHGWSPAAESRGPYAGAKSVAITLGGRNIERGLKQVEHDDGTTAPATRGGLDCRVGQRNRHAGPYIYFQVDDSFKWAKSMDVEIEVEYFDDKARFTVEYDSNDPGAPFAGGYTRCPQTVTSSETARWKTAAFTVRNARFANVQNADADFRIRIQSPSLHVHRVTVTRRVKD